MILMIIPFKLIAIIISAIIGTGVGVVGYFLLDKLPKEEKIKKLKKWLVFAVSEAENIYGEKLGVLKLEHVYTNFTKVFPKLSEKITFDEFSKYVDEALEQMKKYMESNKRFKEYVLDDLFLKKE